jgi:hypothetical protein
MLLTYIDKYIHNIQKNNINYYNIFIDVVPLGVVIN